MGWNGIAPTLGPRGRAKNPCGTRTSVVARFPTNGSVFRVATASRRLRSVGTMGESAQSLPELVPRDHGRLETEQNKRSSPRPRCRQCVGPRSYGHEVFPRKASSLEACHPLLEARRSGNGRGVRRVVGSLASGVNAPLIELRLRMLCASSRPRGPGRNHRLDSGEYSLRERVGRHRRRVRRSTATVVEVLVRDVPPALRGFGGSPDVPSRASAVDQSGRGCKRW